MGRDSQVEQSIFGDESNRRIFPRLKRNVGVWYRVPGGSFRRGHTVEMSVGGAAVVVEQSLAHLPEIELTLDLEPDWKVECIARPKWQREMIPGVRFVLGVEYEPVISAYRHLMGPWLYRQIHAERRKRRGEDPAPVASRPEVVPPILWSPAAHRRRPESVPGEEGPARRLLLPGPILRLQPG